MRKVVLFILLVCVFSPLLSRRRASNTVEGNTTNGAFTGTYAAQ